MADIGENCLILRKDWSCLFITCIICLLPNDWSADKNFKEVFLWEHYFGKKKRKFSQQRNRIIKKQVTKHHLFEVATRNTRTSFYTTYTDTRKTSPRHPSQLCSQGLCSQRTSCEYENCSIVFRFFFAQKSTYTSNFGSRTSRVIPGFSFCFSLRNL